MYCYCFIRNFYFTVPPHVAAFTSLVLATIWNHTAVIQFNVTNAQPPISAKNIRWFFTPTTSRMPLLLANGTRHVFSADKQTLTIHPVLLNDAGMYTLEASNPGGASSGSVEVFVFGKHMLQL